MWFKCYSIFMSCKGVHGRKDSHRDNSAHLRVVEFFCHCVAHQDVFNTHLLLLTHNKVSFKKKLRLIALRFTVIKEELL